MGKSLSHLSDDQVQDMIQKYYDGEKINDLLSEYQITVRPSVLVSLFPLFVHQDLFCPYCQTVNMESKRVSRSSGPRTFSIPICTECHHKDTESCRCDSCDLERQTSLNMKRNIVYKTFLNKEALCAKVEDLTLQDALYLLSLVKHSASEDLSAVDPFNAQAPTLTPTGELQGNIVKKLNSKNLIQISVDSPIDAFVFDEGGNDIESYYLAKVLWELLPNMTTPEKITTFATLRKESLMTGQNHEGTKFQALGGKLPKTNAWSTIVT